MPVDDTTTPNTTPEVSDPGSGPSLFDQLLFGSEGRGKEGFVGPSSQPTTSVNQQKSLNALLELLFSSLEEGGGGDFSKFTGKAPGQNPLQAMSLAGLEGVAAGQTDVFAGPTGVAARGALNEQLGSGPEDFQDFFEKTVFAPGLQDLERTLQAVNAAATGSGNLFGSERAEQAGRTTQDFIDATERERARTGLEFNLANRGLNLQALGLVPEIAGLDIGLGRELFGAGEDARQVGVDQFRSDLAIFQSEQERKSQLIQQLIQLAGTPTFGVTGGFPLSGGSSSSTGGALDAFLGAFNF